MSVLQSSAERSDASRMRHSHVSVSSRVATVVRILVGFLLCVAACFKGYALATGPVAPEWAWLPRWAHALLVEYEALLGLALVSGCKSRWTRKFAFATFVLFGSVAGWMLYSGTNSCGCLGRISAPPGLMLAVDACVAVLLVAFQEDLTAIPTKPLSKGYVGGAGVIVSLVLCAAWPMLSYRPATLSGDGIIHGAGRVVVLEPAEWVGRRFPLLDHIDINDQLDEGSWHLVLYHHNCGKCTELMGRLVGSSSDIEKIAWIELPPYGIESRERLEFATHGELTDEWDWFAQMPAQVWLDEGIVTRATQ